MGRPARPWFRTEKNAWYATVGGKPRTLGVRGRHNEKEAWRVFERLTRSGVVRADPTVAEVVRDFLKDLDQRATANCRKVYRYFLATLTERHGGMKARALTPALVEAAAKKPTWGNDTRADFIGVCVTAVRWAVREGLLKENPLQGAKKPRKVPRGGKVLLSENDVAKLLAAANPAHRTFLRLLRLTGARPGELARATADDINLAAGVVLLRRHKTADKTGDVRKIFLPDEAVEILRPLVKKHPTGPVLRTAKGGEWTVSNVYERMRKLKKRAGVPHAITYGFRHTFGHDALSKGVPDTQVAALMGHKGTAMLHRNYSHITENNRLLRGVACRLFQE